MEINTPVTVNHSIWKGLNGIIVKVSDEGNQPYLVRFGDGSECWFNREDLEV